MIEIILLFIFLLFAHYIADFALQSAFLAENKYKSHHIMFAHCMIYTGVLSIVLLLFDVLTLALIGFILLSHFIIDTLKGLDIKAGLISIEALFHIDQVLHIVIIGVIVLTFL